MPVERVKVEGFDDFQETVKKYAADKEKKVFVLFSGSKDQSGASWCPDCVSAEPVINSVLNELDKEADQRVVFIYVGVGERNFWKDPKCVFRTDKSTLLKSVPTLIRWGQPGKLEEEQCQKKDLVDMLFREE